MTSVALPRPPCPCGAPHKARGLCATHYKRAVRSDRPPSPEWRNRLLTVDPGTQYEYRCDTCTIQGTYARVGAVGMGTHYCYDHYPLRRCRVCDRYIRPPGAVLRYWPETQTPGSDGRCRPCDNQMIERVDTEPLPIYAVTRVKNLVHAKVTDPQDRQVILETLGIKEESSHEQRTDSIRPSYHRV